LGKKAVTEFGKSPTAEAKRRDFAQCNVIRKIIKVDANIVIANRTNFLREFDHSRVGVWFCEVIRNYHAELISSTWCPTEKLIAATNPMATGKSVL